MVSYGSIQSAVADSPTPSLVVGARGFLGGNLVEYLRSIGVDTREAHRETPLESLSETDFNVVFFCAGNSKTYVSLREPLTCLEENVGTLYRYLTTLRYRKWFHLSSSAVYPENVSTKEEEMPISLADAPLYGAHKLLSERYVRQFAERWVIVRPGGFYGKGLKKNLLFDIRAGRKDVYFTRDSYLDYLNVRQFAEIAVTLAECAENEVLNVGSGFPLSVAELLAMKPNNYIFHDERRQSDKGFSLERLRAYYSHPMTEAAFREDVLSFLLSSDSIL